MCMSIKNKAIENTFRKKILNEKKYSFLFSEDRECFVSNKDAHTHTQAHLK